MRLFDKNFKKNWYHFVIQTIMAMIAIFLIAWLLGPDKVVIISSMGATAFICFAIPKAQTAQTLNVLGGHIVGLICGALLTMVHLHPPLKFSLAVGLAIFLMVILNVEHPPAAGTALAVTIHEVDLNVAVAIMISALVITQLRYYMRKWLENLL